MPGYMYHFLLAAPGPWTVTLARMMLAASDRKKVFVNIDSIQDLHSQKTSQTVEIIRSDCRAYKAKIKFKILSKYCTSITLHFLSVALVPKFVYCVVCIIHPDWLV